MKTDEETQTSQSHLEIPETPKESLEEECPETWGSSQAWENIWAPSGGRLFSGLLAINVVFLGTALITSVAFNRTMFKKEEARIYMILLMIISMLWMIWYLVRARYHPEVTPHIDLHAGSLGVKGALLVFTAFSLMFYFFKVGYNFMKVKCKHPVKFAFPLVEVPFVAVQTFFLWSHSRDCTQVRKNFTRSGLLMALATNVLLWLSAVMDDTIHLEIEEEKAERLRLANSTSILLEQEGRKNKSHCPCGPSAACDSFKRGYKLLYPFKIEYCLTAACVLYVMWKNVGRRINPLHHHCPPPFTKLKQEIKRVIMGPLLGAVVLLTGLSIFVYYQMRVSTKDGRDLAFLLFYGYHLVILPIMSLCCLVGTVIHKVGEGQVDKSHNPSRSLDVMLLIAAAVGQLSICYFSLVAALAVNVSSPLYGLDLSYSLLCLIELLFQNVFIIEGLHRVPKPGTTPKATSRRAANGTNGEDSSFREEASAI